MWFNKNYPKKSAWYDIEVVKALLFYLVSNKKSRSKNRPQDPEPSSSKSSGGIGKQQSSDKQLNLKILTKIDTIMQFIEYKENVMDVVKELSSKYKNDFHPFLVVAKLNGLPFKYYLSIFNIIYQFESFTAAFDYLFKSFFVFDVAYPKLAQPFYVFIQQFIYCIYLSTDRKFNTVINLIGELDPNRLPSQSFSFEFHILINQKSWNYFFV